VGRGVSALGPVDRALDALTDMAGDRVLEAYLDQFGVPVDLHRLAQAALVTGMDMGMAFVVEFQAEARVVIDHVGHAAELTDADRAQRTLTFRALVDAARGAA